MNHGHTKARQFGDQMQCAACGKSWDVNDPEPPECTPAPKTARQQRGKQWCNALREKIRNA